MSALVYLHRYTFSVSDEHICMFVLRYLVRVLCLIIRDSIPFLAQLSELFIKASQNAVSVYVWMLTKVAQIIIVAHRDL